jgi:hypothetical protein
MPLPPDLVLSVEVHVVNQTKYRLAVEACQLFGACKWLDGETPAQGNSIAMYQDVVWGAYTASEKASANAFISLIGLGDGPANIHILIDLNGVASCNFTGNNGLAGTVTQINSGDGASAQFQLILNPIIPLPAFATDARTRN